LEKFITPSSYFPIDELKNSREPARFSFEISLPSFIQLVVEKIRKRMIAQYLKKFKIDFMIL